MSTKISKDDLKSPDQVTQTLRKGFVWTTGHSKLVITAVAVFVVLGAGLSLMSFLSNKKETEQQEKYFALEKSYTEKKRGFEEAARAETINAQSKDKKNVPAFDPAKKASGDLQKDYGTVVAGFESFINEAPKTKAAQMAALNLSEIYINYKKSDEASAILAKVESGLSKGDMLTGLVLMQIGNVLADKGDCKAAVEKWQTLVDAKGLAFAHDEAKLRMGLCFESMNDLAKAEALYTEIAQKEDLNTTDFAASKEAQKYLRLLKAKKNL
ncbi:tetratricopeptide repeat protein [Bdellovibrio bacteriovorus]|uniref:tetratricopeptide repeat protein n=1 Tax=Bdellovibrio bacteriovorus TaxID=959 RepID=UPI0021CF3630|nr:tetratricopeptide repeat protein [Bdellovibrio bacteriovorus]UXR63515.1 tetratricopeptide repeat protein [Bdellovibrio bacteriovorus]